MTWGSVRIVVAKETAAATFNLGSSCPQPPNPMIPVCQAAPSPMPRNTSPRAAATTVPALDRDACGFGYAKEYPVEQLHREVAFTRLAQITEGLIMRFIAEQVLDLPKSY